LNQQSDDEKVTDRSPVFRVEYSETKAADCKVEDENIENISKEKKVKSAIPNSYTCRLNQQNDDEKVTDRSPVFCVEYSETKAADCKIEDENIENNSKEKKVKSAIPNSNNCNHSTREDISSIPTVWAQSSRKTAIARRNSKASRDLEFFDGTRSLSEFKKSTICADGSSISVSCALSPQDGVASYNVKTNDTQMIKK